MNTNLQQHVWIAGLGAISSIGMNVDENLASLKNKQSGVGYPEFLKTMHTNDLPVCEIKKSNEELALLCGMKNGLPRTVYLSAIAAMEAVLDVRCQMSDVRNAESHSQLATLSPQLTEYRIGFISGNTIGGMDKSDFFYEEFLQDKSKGHLHDVVHHECGSLTELVAEHLGINDFVTTISTACSSSANAIIHASRLLKHHKLDIVVAGGADALCRFTLNGFNTLMILDSEPSKPFDENRKGLNLGEGAAYVVLVSDKVKEALGLRVYGKVAGYANANDAFHQTASSAEGNGNYKAMKEALNMSGLLANEIQYVNAHGTGTSNNDSSEGIALQRLFENAMPLISSTKANTGHTLGACGALEAVYSCLALKHNIVFPNLRHETTMKELSFTPNKELIEDIEVNHVMSNSFGFGGNCTSIIFSKAKEKK